MRTYNVLIIEDEIPAQANLRRAIERQFDDLRVVGVESSVSGAVAWLGEEQNVADIIFMDVELSDGSCFAIFKQCQVKGKVIITTAFDNYAIQAFRVNSIDYLLKPFKEEELRRAWDKLERLTTAERSAAERKVREVAAAESLNTLLVRYKDKIIPVAMADVAFFYTFAERVTLTTLTGESYPVDKTLEALSQQLTTEEFFRANRQFIVSRRAVKDIAVWFGSRLALNLTLETPERIIISKARVPEFKQWLQSAHRTV